MPSNDGVARGPNNDNTYLGEVVPCGDFSGVGTEVEDGACACVCVECVGVEWVFPKYGVFTEGRLCMSRVLEAIHVLW